MRASFHYFSRPTSQLTTIPTHTKFSGGFPLKCVPGFRNGVHSQTTSRHRPYSAPPGPKAERRYLRLRGRDGEAARPNASTNHTELRLPNASDDKLALPAIVSLVRVFKLQVVSGSRRNGWDLDC